MHRIDTSTAQKDKFGSGKNGFTGGNPQTGELPTALDADFFDSLQEEIAGVIEGAGISLSKAKNNQLLDAFKSFFKNAALTGKPTGPTASAGTVDTQLATTEFVKNAGLQVGNIFTINSATSLSVSYLGSSVLLSGAGGFTVTLPGSGNLSGGLYGKFITFLNVSSGDVVVSTVSADNITAGNNSVNSFILKSGDRAIVYLASANYWHLLGGEASLRYSGSFGFSANQPGYQRLPSGIIIQWGITNNSSVNPQVVNLPVAFPNAGLVATASDFSGSYTPTTAIAICSARFISNNQIQVATASQSGTLAADSIQWIAIGY